MSFGLEEVGHESRVMGLTTLISGYITSDFLTVLTVPMVALILAPNIVPLLPGEVDGKSGSWLRCPTQCGSYHQVL